MRPCSAHSPDLSPQTFVKVFLKHCVYTILIMEYILIKMNNVTSVYRWTFLFLLFTFYALFRNTFKLISISYYLFKPPIPLLSFLECISFNILLLIERNAYVLLNACKDIGLTVNIGKTKYMEIGSHRGIIANAHS